MTGPSSFLIEKLVITIENLKEVFLEVLPEQKFLEFMAVKGKLGSQHKFPRVMKGKMLADWERFLQTGQC